MKKFTRHILLAAMFLAGTSLKAHISYSAGTTRDLGAFSVTGLESAVTKSNTVTGNFGWSSGTDSNLGDTHKLRGLRFTLLNTGLVTIKVEGLAVGSVTALSNPGFSLYKGFAHVAPAQLDHDDSVISAAYNDATYGVGNWQGSFNALGNWKIGNDDGVTFADLSSFTYVGNAADGTSALFGAVPGINGDGNADGTVSESFVLSAGDYSIFVGGAEYFGSSNTAAGVSGSNFAFNTTLSVAVIPEPSTYALFVLGAMVMYGIRFRKSDQGRF
ncbi:MAG: PEP-CTERM sorting domain-containing protein [Verrucomicrobiota bacterium]